MNPEVYHPPVIHYEMLPECIERNKRIEDKIDSLVDYSKQINGRYMKHIEESIEYRARIMQVEKEMESARTHRKWLIGIMVSIVFSIMAQIGTFLYMWGRLTQQVETNTHRWEQLIEGGTHKEVK